MRTKRSYWILTLLSLLLFGSVQRVVADDNQPRIMIPAADFTGDGIGGTAWITPSNPYFTVFLWWMNEDRDDTNWIDNPYLTVDGHEIHLSGLAEGKEWTCYNSSNCEVYYYVKAGKTFRAGSNIAFQTAFPDIKEKSHWDDDHYIVLNIYIPNNTEDAKHKVSARGKFHSDEGISGKDYDNRAAKSLSDNDYVESGTTTMPWEFSEKMTKLSMLTWTSPGKQTFTSNNFEEKNWGGFNVSFDDVESDYKISDKAAIKVDAAINELLLTADIPINLNLAITEFSSRVWDAHLI